MCMVPEIPSVEHLSLDCVAFNLVPFGTVCSFQCDPGYDIEFQEQMECGQDGLLTLPGQLPVCRGKVMVKQ